MFWLVSFLIILLAIFIVLISRSLQNKRYRKTRTIDLKNVKIYLIHQKKKEERLVRCKKFFDRYFHDSIIEIVEPVVVNTEKLSRLVHQHVLSPSSHLDILKKKSVYQGSLTMSSLSLYLTNLEIFKKELKRKNYFLILEDDFFPEKDFDVSIKTTLHNLPERWHVIYLQLHHDPDLWKEETQYDNKILIKKIYHQTAAVLYHPDSVSIIMKNVLPIQKQIDHDFPQKLIMTSKLIAYVAHNSKKNGTIINQDNLGGTSTQETHR